MTNYQYTNPLDNGYKQFKLTKKQHNQLFKNRQIKWYDKYEYYYNNKLILLHKFYNWQAVLLNTIMFPLTVLVEGLGDIKEIIKDIKSLFNQKKYGSFISNGIWSNTDLYDDVMKIIKKGNKSLWKIK